MQFTEDQIAFRDTLKRFIDKEVVPIADEVDRNDRFPAEWSRNSATWDCFSFAFPKNMADRART
jgi:alkylation response protein AidB-like acyl-CoA dehydrogenase